MKTWIERKKDELWRAFSNYKCIQWDFVFVMVCYKYKCWVCLCSGIYNFVVHECYYCHFLYFVLCFILVMCVAVWNVIRTQSFQKVLSSAWMNVQCCSIIFYTYSKIHKYNIPYCNFVVGVIVAVVVVVLCEKCKA